MKIADRIDGTGAYQQAINKARYGHRDWLWWKDKRGYHAAKRSADSIKEMLLAVGTSGCWTLICSDGCPIKGSWRIGLNILTQSRRGWA